MVPIWVRVHNSVGRVLASHARSLEFESPSIHILLFHQSFFLDGVAFASLDEYLTRT